MRTPFLLSVHHLSKQLPGQAALHHTWRHHHHTGTYVVTVVHTLERPSGDETSETGNARVWDPASSLRAVLIGVSQANLPDIIDPYVEYGPYETAGVPVHYVMDRVTEASLTHLHFFLGRECRMWTREREKCLNPSANV